MKPMQKIRKIDWPALRRLRSIFLSGVPSESGYWRGEHDLEAYDQTFAQRIAWKWDAALHTLKHRGWQPAGGQILDWGCGSGIATRMFLSAFPEIPQAVVQFHDHSEHATRFAERRLREAYPAVKTGAVDEPNVLLLSHIASELTAAAEMELERIIRRSETFIWVDSGDRNASALLIRFRERLLEDFIPVAPCTHSAACGMLAPENARHWCHFFARPPAFVHTDPDWSNFAKELGIDVRSVPYSYLVMARRGHAAPAIQRDPSEHRILGRPRLYKGYAQVLACGEEGVADLQLLQRTDRDLYRAFQKGTFPTALQMEIEGKKITQVKREKAGEE